jgi:hypothetical protein
MILRVLNIIVLVALVLAAAYVYRIKFNSTVRGEHLAKLRTDVRHERDSIATLRARWGELDNPSRVEALASRYLHLKPIAPTQFDSLDHLPDRPPEDARTANDDPIGGMIGNLEEPETVTGSIPASTGTPPATASQPPAPAAAVGGPASPAPGAEPIGAPKP